MSTLKITAKIASITGFIVAGTGYAFRFKIQHDIRESKLYKEALQYFYNHEKALELLGTPVVEGRVNISDKEAYNTRNNIGWIKVPLKGSKRRGELYIESLIDVKSSKSEAYNIYKIELKVNDMPNKVFVIKDDSASVKDTI